VVAVFEVKKEEYVHKTLRLSKPLVEELARCAADHQVSVNELVTQCCRYALSQMKRDGGGGEARAFSLSGDQA